MAYIFYNPNPKRLIVGDCVIRAVSRLIEKDWDATCSMVSLQGFIQKDMPSSNDVWGEVLRKNHFIPEIVLCQFSNPPCNVREFAEKHSHGRYLLFVGGHVITVVDGDYYDTWDSGDEIPSYYWKEK